MNYIDQLGDEALENMLSASSGCDMRPFVHMYTLDS
jgi:hypothetical protein